MLIPVYNPETTDYEKSYLANNYSAGATSLEVSQNERFAEDDRIMIGQMGHEKTEIVTVSSVNANGTTIVTGATLHDHSADDPVTVLQFDQVKIYRSTTGSSGSYSILDTVALDVDNPSLQTVYDDTSGLSTYYYKITFYHSVDALESALSDPIPGAGWTRRQVGYIIDELLQELSDQAEQNISRSEVIGYFNDVNDDLTTQAAKPFDFLHTRTTLTRTANTAHIDFPTDSNGDQSMWKFDRMDYNYTDTTTDPDTDNTYTLTVVSPEYFRNKYSDNTIDSTTVDDQTQVMTLDTSVNRFRFYPPFETTGAGVFYLHYWKYFTRIDSEGDTIETPTPRVYKLYTKAMYYRKRSVTEPKYNQQADRYMADYTAEKARYNSHNRKDRGTPRSFSIAGPTIKSFRKF